ncbi:MAG: penicillin-binding protein 1A [Alphaproteobacteria bacterium]|nr:penicillin-binding protein 1A [Alphaproteobacteria bacterium]MBP7761976.1 penicillin-binding protein 1A [Alphaproteobacteria bacterium]MBP7905936.1 penicillin-binding protein 1A [Alphaproteobacteria bacterium]
MKYLRNVFLGLLSLFVIGVIVGVAGVAYIISYYSKDLPDYSQLRNYEPPIVTRLYAGDGRFLAEFAEEKRIFIPIESIPDIIKNAFIAGEDKNFYKHSGIDFVATARALITNLRNKGTGKRSQGASTITQQVAKNFFLSNETTYERKIREAILSYKMTQMMSKDHILELYLNQIFLGGGAYGVAAAAEHYFNKSLEELTIAEAAYLAALPKAPNNYHPVHNHDKAVERRNYVIGRMQEDGYITRAQAELAIASPLVMAKRDENAVVDAPFFAEEVRRELGEKYGQESLYTGGLVVKTSVDPKLQDIAERTLREGLMAYDTRHGWRGPIAKLESMDDWKAQLKKIERPPAILEQWEMAVVLESGKESAKLGFLDDKEGELKLQDVKWAQKYLNEGYSLGAAVSSVKQVADVGDVIMVEPKPPKEKELTAEEKEAGKTPEIQTFEGVYLLRQIPDVQGALIAIDPHTGRILAMQGGWKYGTSEYNRATQAQRQPGSAFKPFVYLAGLDKGFTPATLILDSPMCFEDRPGHQWCPRNYSGESYGPVTLRVGVEKSKNQMTVRLANFLGTELVAKYSDHFGITDKMKPLMSNALGASETTLLRLTTAYAMLVNGGKKIRPTFIDRVQDRHGKTIFRHDDRKCEFCGPLMKWEGQGAPEIADTREQIGDERTAYQMVSILEGVVQRGTGTKIKELNRPLAGKTGTTNRSNDAWFIGFSPDLTVGVFVGFDNPRSLGKKEQGASVAVPIFKDFMEEALEGQPPAPFRRPAGIRNVMVNAKTGARANPGDGNVIWEAFKAGTEPTDEMYMLDEGGIRVLPSYNYDYADSYTPASGDYPGEDIPPYNPDAPYKPPPAQESPGVDTGTGGIY